MSNSAIGRRYGWRPSKPSLKVAHYKSKGLAESELPTLVDLRSQFPACYDQGQLGSCTANGLAGVIEHELMASNYPWAPFTPSRLFIYYNERSLEDTVDSDAGAEIHDGVKTLNQFGVCPETEKDGSTPAWLWTYDDGPTKFKTIPPPACYKDAVLHKALKYQQVSLDRNTVLNTLAAGSPIVFGFTVHESFENDATIQTGVMEVPGLLDSEIGGHCTVVVGYVLDVPLGKNGVKDWAIIRNSWGTDVYQDNPHFGNMAGNFLMPLDQVLCNPKVTSDAWVISLVGN